MDNVKKYIVENKINNADELATLLEGDLKIKCYRDIDQNGDTLYTFKYNQIESVKTHPVVCECRGIVFDYDLNVVFKGFDRFFNVAEVSDNSGFNFSDFKAYEKADGSLIKLYFHNGYWQVGTSGTAMANVPMGGLGWEGGDSKLFRDEVIKCFGYDDEEDFQSHAHESFLDNLWYIFEFTSPDNRIVTPYEESKMVLLGVVHKGSGIELSYDNLLIEFEDMLYGGLNVRLPEVISNLDNIEALIEETNSLSGLKEGYVLVDQSGKRLKLKSEKYVAAHRMRGDAGLTLKRACQLVLLGEWSEYLVYFPDDTKNVMSVVNALNDYLLNVDIWYKDAAFIVDQKEFAMKVKDLSFKHLLFSMKRGNTTAQEAFYQLREGAQINTLMELVL